MIELDSRWNTKYAAACMRSIRFYDDICRGKFALILRHQREVNHTITLRSVVNLLDPEIRLSPHISIVCMHPPLGRPHPQCGDTVNSLISCHKENPFKKYFGVCNDLKVALDICFRAEKELKRQQNVAQARDFARKREAAQKRRAEQKVKV